jgi:dienelactone hydrolase
MLCHMSTAMATAPFDPRSVSIRPSTALTQFPELTAKSFSFSSRGDRVPGRLLLPASDEGPFPLVLLAHGAGGAKDATYMDATAGPWARRGLAVASIDFPLHGERSEAKLYQILASELAGTDSDGPGLATDFAQQALADLSNALGAICGWNEIDAGRLGFAGFSLGAVIGGMFCAGEPRVRAAALALGGAGLGGTSLDPTRDLADFSPRPLLLVNANQDEVVPREAALALGAAAGEPSEHLWFDGSHNQLPGQALKAMYQFFEQHLPV